MGQGSIETYADRQHGPIWAPCLGVRVKDMGCCPGRWQRSFWPGCQTASHNEALGGGEVTQREDLDGQDKQETIVRGPKRSEANEQQRININLLRISTSKVRDRNTLILPLPRPLLPPSAPLDHPLSIINYAIMSYNIILRIFIMLFY
jgi:hypothetical protein